MIARAGSVPLPANASRTSLFSPKTSSTTSKTVISTFPRTTRPAPAPARVGNWYAFSDMTGTSSFNVVTIGRGASHMGFETKGKDYQKWGSGVGVDMATAKAPYDASAYIGLTFWARAETALTVTVVSPPPTQRPTKGADCARPAIITTTRPYPSARRGSVTRSNFADLVLEPDTVPTPGPFPPEWHHFRTVQNAAGHDLRRVSRRRCLHSEAEA